MGLTTTKPTLDEVTPALFALAQWRCDSRDEWVRVGMALSDYDPGPGGFHLFNEWSQQSEKYNQKDCEHVWNSFGKGSTAASVRISTLFALAKEDGWINPSRSTLKAPTESGVAEHSAAVARPNRAATKPMPDQIKSNAEGKSPAHLWKTIEAARATISRLTRAKDHSATAAFLRADYGMCENQIPENWYSFEHPSKGAGILYVGKDPEGSVGIKFKSLSRNEKGKRDVAFLFGTGQAALHYNGAEHLVIVAGEEKAAAAHAAGFSVLSPMVGEKKLSDEWVGWCLERGWSRIYLANDNDAAGEKANRETAEALVEAGIPGISIHLAYWPKSLARGYDLNDLMKEYQTADSVKELLTTFAQPFRAKRSIMTLGEVLHVEVPTDDNLLDSWLLSKRETCALLGVGGIGKSRLALQLAVCSVLGKDFLGLPTHAKGLKWLFLQTENSVRRTKFDLLGGMTPTGEHINGMLSELTASERHTVLNSISVQALLKEIDFQNYLDNNENVQSLRDEIKLANPDIVVWDPLINFFAGEDENSATQMEATLSRIKMLTRAANPCAAAIVVHHGRGGKSGAAGAVGMDKTEFGRGSKALYNFVRGQVNIAWGNEDEENPILIMTCGKNNNGRPFKRRALGLKPGSMWYEVIEDFDWNTWHKTVTGKSAPKAQQGGGRPLTLDNSSILTRLDNGEWKKQKLLAMEIKETTGIGRDTVRRRIDEMIEMGLLDYRDEEQGAYKTRYIRLPQKCQ